MKLLKRLFHHNGSVDELAEEFSAGHRRLCESARKVARAAETVSRQRRENELAEQIEHFRKTGVL